MTLICLLGQNSYAQDQGNWSVLTAAKYHKFYDPGVYELGNTSKAKTRGLGIYLDYAFSEHINVYGGYGFAKVDSLVYGNSSLSKANFHQLDANIAFQLRNTQKRFRPYVNFGYGFNSIPQLTQLSEIKNGMNSNFGYGFRVKLVDGIFFDYNNSYGFTYSENIRFNFRHQFGVMYTFKQVNQQKANIISDERYQELLQANVAEQNRSDSLRAVIKTLSNQKFESVDNSLLAHHNDQLTKRVKYLEEDNYRLLTELAYRRWTLDSLIQDSVGLLQVLDSTLKPKTLIKSDYKSGYYIILDSLSSKESATDKLKITPFDLLSPTYTLQQSEQFLIMGWLSDDPEKAKLKFDALDNGRGVFRFKEVK